MIIWLACNIRLFADSGSCPLFRSLESQILNAIPLDTCEWRRTFQRPTKHVRLEAQAQQFSVDPLEKYKQGDWSILEHPILHIFVTECNVKGAGDNTPLYIYITDKLTNGFYFRTLTRTRPRFVRKSIPGLSC